LLQSAFSGPLEYAVSKPTRKSQVAITNLNDALNEEERPIDFIKCDVERGELAILRGAIDILVQDRPFLVLEGEMPNESLARPREAEFVNFLDPLGYEGFHSNSMATLELDH
jgi:hypothetical protein